MITRLLAAAATLLLAAALLAGCADDPQPADSASPFATEEEAFAAAEATYRAYVDAVNAHREDPTATPAPQEFLIGEALEDDLETRRQLEQQGLMLVGPTHVGHIEGLAVEPSGAIHILVCLDSSAGRVLDATGEDITPADRQTQPALEVALIIVGEQMLISNSEGSSRPCH